MATHVLWSGAGEAEFLLIDGERVELRSTEPFAPGSRPAGRLAAASEHAVWLKVHRSHREDDGRYHVWGRLLNVTRQLRVRLDAIMAERRSDTSVELAPAGSSPAASPTQPSSAGPQSVEPVVAAGSISGASPLARPPCEARLPDLAGGEVGRADLDHASCGIIPSSLHGPSDPAIDSPPTKASTAFVRSSRIRGDDKESSS